MPELTLEDLKSQLSYDPDTGDFTWLVSRRGVTQGRVAGVLDISNGYRMVVFQGVRYAEHRLAWFYVHGRHPKDQIDHINGVRDDNRIENLREATSITNNQNQTNRKPSESSNHLGVSFCRYRGKWVAQVYLDQRRVFFKRFATKDAAISARVEAKAKYHTF